MGLGFLILALLLLVVIAGVGIGYSFFSDSDSKQIEIKAGTLTIDASVEYTLNGSVVSSIGNYNPGDVLVIKLTVENGGNKSAWTKATTTITPSTSINGTVYLFDEERTATYCAANKASGYTLAGSTCTHSAAPVVLSADSAGLDPEIETAKTESGYKVLNTNTTVYVFTVYFDSAAGNAAQGIFFTLDFLVEAIQYRNNSSSIPTVWS
jgi:hypothetical protein